MNYTFTPHTGDGNTKVFSFSLAGQDTGYVQRSDIKVFVGGVAVPFTLSLQTPNQVTITTAPPVGAEILIRRIVPKTNTYTDFQSGNPFTADNLNKSFLQGLYLQQEWLDGFLPVGFYLKQNVDVGGHKFTNMAEGTVSGDSVNYDQWYDHELRIEGLEGDLTGLSSRTIPYYYIATGGETRWAPSGRTFDSAILFINGVFQNQNLGAFSITNNGFNFAEPLVKGDEVYALIGSYVTDPDSHPTFSEVQAQFDALKAEYASSVGAGLIGTRVGKTVQELFDTIKGDNGYYKETFSGAKTVNIPSDYPTMQAAVDALHNQTISQGLYIVINLQSGYQEKYGLKVQHGDFSKFYIKSEDATVNVSDDFIGVVGPDGGSTITSGSVIMAYHARGPVLGCIFDGRQIARTLYFALGGSSGWADRLQSSTEESPNPVKVSGGRNFRHATFQAQEGSTLICENTVGTGCMLNSYYCERNSTIHCEFSDASNSLQAGVMATRGSRVNADSVTASGCKLGMWASRGAVISAADAIANNCTVYGFYADMAATINAHNASALAAGTNMPADTGTFVNPGSSVHSYRGSKINFTSGKASGSRYGVSAVIDSDVAAFGVIANNCITAAAFARYSSEIAMDNCTVSGSLASGLVASDASTISANTGSVTSTTGTAVQAVNASRISLASGVVTTAATGVYSDAGSTISVISGNVNATVGLRVNRGGIISATGSTYNNANIAINTINANGIIFA